MDVNRVLRCSPRVATILMVASMGVPVAAALVTVASKGVKIAFTANLRGVLDPCGCQAQQPGGLSRRATLLRQIKVNDPSTILVDLGDNLPANRPKPEMLDFIYSQFRQMGYGVVQAGPFDLGLPAETIRKSANSAQLPVLIPTSGAALPTRTVRIEGVRVALISAVPANREMDAEEMVRRVSTTVKRVTPSVDVVALLSQLPPKLAESCAQRVPNLHLVISGRHDADLTQPRRIGRTLLVPASFYGESVGRIEINWKGKALAPELGVKYLRLDAGVDRDMDVEASVRAYFREHSTLSGEMARVVETEKQLASLFKVQDQKAVGCESCHPAAFRSWKATRHAHAWETLVARGAQARADCVGCHTTTELSLSNFNTNITGVGCATCHGGDPDHARFPADSRFIVRRPAEAVCRTCHTTLQSPKFDYRKLLADVSCKAGEGGAVR